MGPEGTPTTVRPPGRTRTGPGPGPIAGNLARALATIAGFVDGAGYVALFRLFIAHQSGNTAGLGVALSGGDWAEAWRRGAAIVAFTLGVAAGAIAVEMCRKVAPGRAPLVLSLLEMACLAMAMAVGDLASANGRLLPSQTGSYATAAISLAFGMGVQTVSLRRVGGRAVRTTFVTGVLANLAESLVVGLFTRHRKALSFAALLVSVWAGYLAGAVLGGLAQRAWGFDALGVALAAVAAVAVVDLRRPYQPGIPS